MNIPNSMFNELVAHFFAPLAEHAALTFRELREGIYEIAGSQFAMRVRRGTGHRKDFVVTLSSRKSEADLDDLSSEIGLGVIAEYNGCPLQVHALDSVEDWQLALQEAATAAKSFCLPYLQGERSDLDGIRRFIEEKIEASGIRTKKYQFPRNVREEWI